MKKSIEKISGDTEGVAYEFPVFRFEGSDSAAPGAYIQLGAFGNPDNAEAFRSHMARELDWLSERIRLEPGGKIMRVQAGPFRDRAEADAHAEKIRGITGIKPTIVMR